MLDVFLGIIIGMAFMIFPIIYDDYSIDFIEKYVETAYKVCEPYGGPKSFDFNGTTTCNDETEIK